MSWANPSNYTNQQLNGDFLANWQLYSTFCYDITTLDSDGNWKTVKTA